MVGSLDNRHFISICQAPGFFSSLAIKGFPVMKLSHFRKKQAFMAHVMGTGMLNIIFCRQNGWIYF
jgi:hypothetical protein